MIVKLSLVAAFMLTMATLTLAASAIPTVEAQAAEIAPLAVVAQGVVRTTGSHDFAMPKGVVPKAAIELMASL